MVEQIIAILAKMGYVRIEDDEEGCATFAKGKGCEFEHEQYVTFEDEIVVFEDEASRREFFLKDFDLKQLEDGF